VSNRSAAIALVRLADQLSELAAEPSAGDLDEFYAIVDEPRGETPVSHLEGHWYP